MYIQYYTINEYTIEIKANDTAIVAVSFVTQETKSCPNTISRQCYAQLDEYFKGSRTQFQVPLELHGTMFQIQVWNALQGIAYGHLCTYKEIAIQIGNAKASRAVGMANNRNPIGIIVPCHRVIGSDKTLVGYAGGLKVKKFLIEHERSNALKMGDKSEEIL